MLFKKRVIIVEDNAELANGFFMIINSSAKFQAIKIYDKCEDAIRNLKNDRPDIVLMDIQLNGINGIEGTKAIKMINPKIDVLVLSMYDESQFVFEALKVGASGYITKSSNYTEIIKALEEVVAGGSPMSTMISRMVVDTFRINPDSPLSKRESEILQLMSQGKTYTEIAGELNISPETSKTHIKNIYSKLQVKSKSEALKKASHHRLI